MNTASNTMGAFFEGRRSDSPLIEMVWRGSVDGDYTPVCPADVHWNLLFTKWNGRVRVAVEGPLTTAITKTQPKGLEFLVIKFTLGTYLERLPVKDLANEAALLPDATPRFFHLDGSRWEAPDFDNVEAFVGRLSRSGALTHDPIVHATALDQPDRPILSQAVAPRTLRRRFVYATGVTQGTVRQVERARQAVALLQRGTAIPDAAYQAGYADQPHLTRALRRFYGLTPAQIMRGDTRE